MEITVNASNFENEVLQAEQPVLVDFWATWCGPCRMIAPTVAEIAEEQAGKVKVAKINVDDEPALAAKYGVSSIPMLCLFKGGEVVKTTVGVQSKEKIEAMLH